jgi:hypothetical protein
LSLNFSTEKIAKPAAGHEKVSGIYGPQGVRIRNGRRGPGTGGLRDPDDGGPPESVAHRGRRAVVLDAQEVGHGQRDRRARAGGVQSGAADVPWPGARAAVQHGQETARGRRHGQPGTGGLHAQSAGQGARTQNVVSAGRPGSRNFGNIIIILKHIITRISSFFKKFQFMKIIFFELLRS